MNTFQRESNEAEPTDNSTFASVDYASSSTAPGLVSRQQPSSQGQKRKYVVSIDHELCDDPEDFDGIKVLHACGDEDDVLVTKRIR